MAEVITPFAHRGFFLAPFSWGGEESAGASGIVLHHHRLLPVTYGRVTATHHTCRAVRTGDWVVFLPGRPVRSRLASGESLYSLDERQVLGVIENGSGRPWFAAGQAVSAEKVALQS